MLWREKGNFDLTHGFKDNKAMSARQNNNSKGGGKKIVKRNKKETKLNRDEIIAAYRKMKAAKNKQPRKQCINCKFMPYTHTCSTTCMYVYICINSEEINIK